MCLIDMSLKDSVVQGEEHIDPNPMTEEEQMEYAITMSLMI